MTYYELEIGDEVYWKDPAGETSGVYKVVAILSDDLGDETIVLISNGYSEAEVYLSELS